MQIAWFPFCVSFEYPAASQDNLITWPIKKRRESDGDLTWWNMATDFAVLGGLSAVAYGAPAFVAAGAYTALLAPVAGT
jgi:hypothetical protein